MIDHKIRLGSLAFALFLISIAAGAFWEYGLRGAIRFSALRVLQATSATAISRLLTEGLQVRVGGAISSSKFGLLRKS
jgi:hypothetical protein